MTEFGLTDRLRRKVEIIRLDAKQRGYDLGGHASEMLTLITLIEKYMKRQENEPATEPDRHADLMERTNGN